VRLPEKKYELPSPSGEDLAHSAVRAAVSLVPGVGSPALEFFNHLFGSPVEKRRQEWMEGVAEGLRQIEAYPELRANKEFYTQVAKDLWSDRLLNTDSSSLNAIMSAHGAGVNRTTEMGNNFLKFITEPPRRAAPDALPARAAASFCLSLARL
jgi:hypothetical protein